VENKDMVKKLIVFLGFTLAIAACQDKGLNLHITFDQIQGLKGDDRVIFDQSHIGRVTGVRYAESGSFTVHVEINREFAMAVTEHSRFFIETDPADKTRKALEMIQVTKGGTPLKDGTTVSGSSKHSALFNQKCDSFEKGIEDLKKKFQEFSDQFRDIPEGGAYKELEKEIRRLSEEIKRAGEMAREKIEKEMLPRLKKELEKLRERLFKLKEKEETEKPLEA